MPIFWPRIFLWGILQKKILCRNFVNIEEKVKISDGIKEKYEKYCVSLIPFSIHFTIPFYLFFATFSPFLLF